ncbi:MAG: hypothetical protein RLZZ426_9 [Actinomycetota bacterium]|jgi:cellobiose transport system substrate-binding protein
MGKSKFLTAAAAVFSLAAVSFGTAAPAEAVTTITIASFGEVIKTAKADPKGLVAQYEKLHPNIKIQISISSMDEVSNSLTTKCLSRKTPDIVAIEISWSGRWRQKSSCLTDLRTMSPSASTLESKYLGWRWDQGVAFDGKVIGIPTDVGGYAVAYRTDLFKAAGLPTDRAKVAALWPTWDKFIATGKAFKLKTKKAFIDNSGNMFAAILNQGNQKFYNNSGGFVYATNPQVKTAFNTATKAMTTSFPASSKLKADIGARIAPFTTDWIAGINKGAFAVTLAPAWMMDYIKKDAPKTKGKWDIATIPGGTGNLGGTQLAIPAFAPNKVEAWKFLSWYTAPAQQLQVFKKYGIFPAASSLYTNVALKGYKDPFFNNAPVGSIYIKSVAAVQPIIEGEKQRIIDQIFGQALSRVARGAQTPAAAWSQTMTDIRKSVGG